ncbi:MAG: hypothetical protein ACQKBV_03120 [Puniceicoccales bacterium]
MAGSDPKLPPHVVFPDDWEHVASHGVGRFVTRVIHRLPSGALHVWSSRRHRKHRGGVIHEANGGLHRQAVAGEVSADHAHEHTRQLRRDIRLWGWRSKELSWWIGVIFILGSICFVVGTVPAAFPGVLDWFGLKPFNYGLVDFIGSIWFTFGSYLLVLEAVNADFDATLRLKAEHIAKHLVKRVETPPGRRIRWWGFEPKRLDYCIAVVQFTGAVIFNINCGMALVEGMDWLIADILVWTPSTLASCCFVTASYLGVVEVAHKKWAWLWWDLSWWVNWFSLLGSLGFLVSSLVGYFGQGPVQFPQWWGNFFALMMGSWFFLAGTYLLVPEVLIEEE